jgi:hypothetical protein
MGVTRSPRSVTSEAQLDPYDGLDEASNAVVDMVHAGKLDEAEAAAHDLLVFPEVHDGYDRLGMVAKARGDKRLAATYYRGWSSSPSSAAISTIPSSQPTSRSGPTNSIRPPQPAPASSSQPLFPRDA